MDNLNNRRKRGGKAEKMAPTESVAKSTKQTIRMIDNIDEWMVPQRLSEIRKMPMGKKRDSEMKKFWDAFDQGAYGGPWSRYR